MVRLKGSLLKNSLLLKMFQFQYGAIKGNKSDNTIIATYKFQFQYGAIKGTRTRTVKSKSRQRFQFQYGAIKGTGRLQFSQREFCFNSNMVRLKAQLCRA